MSQWSEDYKVNVATLDEQHKTLLSLINDLDSRLKGDNQEDISFIITELNAYALYHFAAEERLLSRFGFPELNAHRSEHREFELKIYEFRSQFMNNDPNLPFKVKEFLENWIIDHIKRKDKKYSQFLNNNGIF